MAFPLDPTVAGALDDLELAARVVVEGLRAGGHRSPLHGYSAEFSQHRPYRAGDDLKYLDWKVLARTDRLYSRQFRESTSLSAMIVLDASASMDFPDGPASKFRYGSVVAAALARLLITQGDAAGLMAAADDRLTYLPAKGGRSHLRAITAAMARLSPSGTWRPERAIARGAELLRRRGVIIVISDFYDAEDETRRELRRARRRGHDVAMLQVIAREEITLPYSGDLEFEDLESGQRRVVDAGSLARGYRAAVAGFLGRCRTGAHRDGVDYVLMPTDIAPAHALRRYLLRRSAEAAPGQAAVAAIHP
jgi:uncharacterized protein (DUF58 family)